MQQYAWFVEVHLHFCCMNEIIFILQYICSIFVDIRTVGVLSILSRHYVQRQSALQRFSVCYLTIFVIASSRRFFRQLFLSPIDAQIMHHNHWLSMPVCLDISSKQDKSLAGSPFDLIRDNILHKGAYICIYIGLGHMSKCDIIYWWLGPISNYI